MVCGRPSRGREPQLSAPGHFVSNLCHENCRLCVPANLPGAGKIGEAAGFSLCLGVTCCFICLLCGRRDCRMLLQEPHTNTHVLCQPNTKSFFLGDDASPRLPPPPPSAGDVCAPIVRKRWCLATIIMHTQESASQPAHQALRKSRSTSESCSTDSAVADGGATTVRRRAAAAAAASLAPFSQTDANEIQLQRAAASLDRCVPPWLLTSCS